MKCDSCNIEYGRDAKFCQQCGKPIDNCSESREEESAAERNTPDEVVESRAISVRNVDFSNQSLARQVIALPNGAGGVVGRSPRRALLVTLSAVCFALLLTLIGVGFIVKRIAELQHINDRLASEVETKQRTNDRLDEEIADGQEELKRLEEERGVVEKELKETETKVASTQFRLSEINSNIRDAKNSLKNSRAAVAKLEGQRDEVSSELRGLTSEVGQRRSQLASLQGRIDQLRRVNHASMNRRRSRRK